MKLGLHTLFWPITWDGKPDPRPMAGWAMDCSRIPGVVHKALHARQWATVDRWVDPLHARGIRPMVIVEPDHPDVVAIAAEAATLYRGKLLSVEVGNELEAFEKGWMDRGRAVDYVATYRLVRAAVKAADPVVMVLHASLYSLVNGGHGRRLLHRWLDLGLESDSLNLHHYESQPEQPRLAEVISSVRADLWAYRRESWPIWITELGVETQPAFNARPVWQQHQWMARLVGEARRLGVARAVWYCWEASNPHGFQGADDANRWNSLRSAA